jgi:DNA-binding MarR family transcriptional regulator
MMEPGHSTNHSPAGAALTDLLLAVFRLNGRLLASGDRLVADLGLTSARWQVLGAVALAGEPLPVASIARNMGLTRQAVQRVVNELARMGLVQFTVNPHHRRAKLVRLTEEGRNAYRAATDRQVPWANSLAANLNEDAIDTALAVARTLIWQLEGGQGLPPASGLRPPDGQERKTADATGRNG